MVDKDDDDCDDFDNGGVADEYDGNILLNH